jgi:hypothetical protein
VLHYNGGWGAAFSINSCLGLFKPYLVTSSAETIRRPDLAQAEVVPDTRCAASRSLLTIGLIVSRFHHRVRSYQVLWEVSELDV